MVTNLPANAGDAECCILMGVIAIVIEVQNFFKHLNGQSYATSSVDVNLFGKH